MANPGTFLAEVHELEKQTERMGDLVRFILAQRSNEPPFRGDAGAVMLTADGLGKLPELFDVEEDAFAGLFSNNQAEPCSDEPDFLAQLFHSSRVSIARDRATSSVRAKKARWRSLFSQRRPWRM